MGSSTILVNWQASANCLGLDTNLFYYDVNERCQAKRNRAEMAKKICANCPVQLECLMDAVERKDAFSVQGGTTPEERGHPSNGKLVSQPFTLEEVLSRKEKVNG